MPDDILNGKVDFGLILRNQVDKSQQNQQSAGFIRIILQEAEVKLLKKPNHIGIRRVSSEEEIRAISSVG